MPVPQYELLTGDAQIALTQFAVDLTGAFISSGEPITEKISTPIVTAAPRVRMPLPIAGLKFAELGAEQTFMRLGAKSLELIPRTYQQGVEALADEVEDPSWLGWDKQPESLGVEARMLADSLVGALLSAGHTGAACWDGGAQFFAVDHPVNCLDPTMSTPAGAFIFSNYDVALGFSAANLETAMTQVRRTPGPNGLPMRIQPKYLIVPPDLEQAAKNALLFDLVANTAGTAGIRNTIQNALEIVVLPDLDSATEWYIAGEKLGCSPWKIVRRAAPELIICDKTDQKYKDYLKVSVSAIMKIEAALAIPHVLHKFGA